VSGVRLPPLLPIPISYIMIPSRQISEKVFSFCSSIIKPDSAILAAVSGGADSVALVNILNELRPKLQLKKILIAHVNYGLRGEESDQDETYVKQIACALNLDFRCLKLKGRSLEMSGIEEWARAERYRFFQELKKEFCLDYIATGHTLDDQAETVLMRILRGTGIRGLRGIISCRDDGVIRPLIEIRRSELVEWLKIKNVQFRTDSSNFDIKYRRNWIRSEIIPQLISREPLGVEHLGEIALSMQRVWNIMDEKINNWIEGFVISMRSGAFAIKKEGLKDSGIAMEALRTLFENNGISSSHLHIKNVIIESTRTSGEFLLGGGWSFFPGKDVISFEKDGFASNFEFTLKIPGTTDCSDFLINIEELEKEFEKRYGAAVAVVDKEKCGDELVLRTVKKDDEFIPFGQNRSVNVLKFLAKSGKEAFSRERSLVVSGKDNKVIWVAGIRINDEYKVRTTTKRALKLSIQQKNIR
jgi:tRNA(Ile)-lysidine synthase